MNTHELKEITAYHEAGHMVVAKSYGLDVDTLELSNNYFKLKFNTQGLDTKSKAVLAYAGYVISKLVTEPELLNEVESLSNSDIQMTELYLDKLPNITKQDLENEIISKVDIHKLNEYKNKIMVLLNLNLVPFSCQ